MKDVKTGTTGETTTGQSDYTSGQQTKNLQSTAAETQNTINLTNQRVN